MNDPKAVLKCPACGASLSRELASEGLCLACLMELAVEAPSLTERPDSPEEAATLGFGDADTYSVGQILGGRFRIRSRLGHGGMGEVWRATDLKLRVDVALKALRAELLGERHALESLRQEVRMAREVVSPNVCRVFDLVEIDGTELVSMEYIDGVTLLDILKARAPLDLSEARDVAAQFLAGLEAIHQAGLVHRDVKPENLMVTRSERVVLMDFGIAKGLAEARAGTVSGTPAYMAPEQARGDASDARSDVFSAGVVLAEMTAPEGAADIERRQAIWKGIHSAPPELPDSPWAPVLAAAVAPGPEDRPPGAAALARALEEVTLRIDRAEDVHPYPGLAAFSEANAQFFFGRELEVEEMWKKLRRPQLYGLIGPSGAGKSSFLRAGLLPVMPAGWGAMIATPGNQPFVNVGRALVPLLSGDTEALQLLVDADDPSAMFATVGRWRQRYDHALLVLDQFEELFTLNPPETQKRFTRLLGRLALEADVHVLLSMRDDFLFHCSSHPALSPMFSELTPLRAPSGAALRRALVQPALKCGYRFEDDSLVDEMLEEVGQERGALPMLAFAAARLWEYRDREQGTLTREAYEHTGGVAGALAQHAERALEHIGRDNVPVVRELFRNLVTSQGTRGVRTRAELLSVFSAEDTPVAEEVVGDLIDARLLTSYEVQPDEAQAATQQRIEIVHESLLTRWPRLVRWQAQDQEGALLRDQLRQAAQLWHDRGRAADLLWTGTSYQEYELWRDRYSGGLSSAEEQFARAMTAHAQRRKRQRRLAVAAVIALLSLGLAIVGTLWQQAAAARALAEEQKQSAEASQLLSLARLEDSSPTNTFAYALASLERADSPAARLLALEILSRDPLAFALDSAQAQTSLDFSPDGQWLAVGHHGGELKLWPAVGEPRLLATEPGALRGTEFGPDSDTLVALDHQNDVARIRSIPDGVVLRTVAPDHALETLVIGSPGRLLTFTGAGDRTRIESWPLDGGEPELLAERNLGLGGWYERNFRWGLDVDPAGERLAYIPMNLTDPAARNEHVLVLPLDNLGGAPSQRVAHHPETILRVEFHPDGRHLATGGLSGEVRIWDLEAESGSPRRRLRQPPGYVNDLAFDVTGSRLAAASASDHVAVWDLEGAPDAAPMLLRVSPAHKSVAFHPGGEWLATADASGVKAWPIGRARPIVLEGHEDLVWALVFLPGGESIVSVSADGTARLWPLSSQQADGARILLDLNGYSLRLAAADPAGKRVLVAGTTGQIWLVPLDGGDPRQLTVFDTEVSSIALGARLVAAMGSHAGARVLRLWDLETGETRDLDPGDEVFGVVFSPDGELISARLDGIGRWDLVDDRFEIFAEFPEPIDFSFSTIGVSTDGRRILLGDWGDDGEAVLFDLEAGTMLQLDAHGRERCGMLDDAGRVAVTWSCGKRGPILVGPAGAGPVHMLGSGEELADLLVSPDGRWIAAATGNELRLWPMPDRSEPPLYAMPHDALVAKLRKATNVRAVPDLESTTGWSLSSAPFSGWQEVPSW